MTNRYINTNCLNLIYQFLNKLKPQRTNFEQMHKILIRSQKTNPLPIIPSQALLISPQLIDKGLILVCYILVKRRAIDPTDCKLASFKSVRNVCTLFLCL
jgi:hypothetical protein